MAPSLAAIFNHLVLPTKLPQQQEEDLEAIEVDLLDRTLRACKFLASHAGPEHSAVWNLVCDTLDVCADVNGGYVNKDRLYKWFRSFDLRRFLVLHIRCQNAGLLVRREHRGDSYVVIFELIELSATSEAVLASESALCWIFPGRAVEIPLHEFDDECFQETLAQFLDQASSKTLYEFAAHTTKAGVTVNEVRGTVDPALLTQMLMPMLEAIGKLSEVPRLQKRIRDDVNFAPSGMPWRRLPFWLLLRVAVQRQLRLLHGINAGNAYYKMVIVTMLMHLLQDGVTELPPDSVTILVSKICRRLAKLEMEKAEAAPPSSTLGSMLAKTSQIFNDTVKNATDHVTKVWDNYKQRIKRPIPWLPLRAQLKDQQLLLPNSGVYLQEILNTPPVWNPGRITRALPELTGSMKEFSHFSMRYFDLANSEDEIMHAYIGPHQNTLEVKCRDLAQGIESLMSKSLQSYKENAVQMSNLVLKVFCLWIRLDELVTSACPRLTEYHPVFNRELLDALQISTFSDLQQLRRVQKHLSNRVLASMDSNGSIFSAAGQNSFVVRYYKQTPELQRLGKKIEADSKISRENKRQEWNTYSSQYTSLTQDGQAATCTCSIGIDRSRNSRGCRRCGIYGKRARLSISVHEDYLPKSEASKAVVLFELEMPPHLALYRDATWSLLTTLAHPSREANETPPTTLLEEYGPLSNYLNTHIPRGNITLASVPKSFLGTHYKKQKAKVPVEKVTLPNALMFQYYDKTHKHWALRATTMPPTEHPLPDISGPTSYEIVANQTVCPRGVSSQEFTTTQQLLAGKGLRWYKMARELNSPNLNFSTDETMRLFSALAMQAGPADGGGDGLGVVHSVFRDSGFCHLLFDQIERRLRSISPNAREAPCMEMLLTLSLQLYELDRSENRSRALELVNDIRQATFGWITALQKETQSSETSDTAQVAAERSLYAALLCRRTFTVFVQARLKMTEDDLSTFVRASIALQLNLAVDPEKLQPQMKAMMIRDIKMAFRLRDTVRSAIVTCSKGLSSAVGGIWSDIGGVDSQAFSTWEFVKATETLGWNNSTWVVSVATCKARSRSYHQTIHYNCLEGHLLVDGKALGKLPPEIRESEDVKELFGRTHLMTVPSRMPSMTHMLVHHPKNHQVHFGLRNGTVVIRDNTRDGVLEFIPRSRLRTGDVYDLPASMIDNCVHWLCLDRGCLEIRRKPGVWSASKRSNWILDMKERNATRKRVTLIDPHSGLAKTVAKIFKGFEDPRRLTIFQPQHGHLCVELRHLGLNFVVRDNHLLGCRELKMEIDPNQDAGTLCKLRVPSVIGNCTMELVSSKNVANKWKDGFESKVVLRGINNPHRRSIITASGPLSWKRDGIHVTVDAAKGEEYFRFSIDSTLGRLTCPPEPLLLYSKALFHAITSFVIADSLTGRTGTEEALSLLTSGQCQPWEPLKDQHRRILNVIASLSPKRGYYPKERRHVQTVVWDAHTTTAIQNDCYVNVINRILSRSSDLGHFSLPPLFQGLATDTTESLHLRRRGEVQRTRYERLNAASDQLAAGVDETYESRDRHAQTSRSVNVYQVATALRAPQFQFAMKRDLLDLLSRWNFIGGFSKTPDAGALPLDELIDTSVDEQWGNLVDYCRNSTFRTRSKLMVRLCMLAFSRTSNMDMINVFIAFGRLPQLKGLLPPDRISFTDFKVDEQPDSSRLEASIEPAYRDYVSKRHLNPPDQAVRRQEHRIAMRAAGQEFVQKILSQWPIPTPAVHGFDTQYLDTDAALQMVMPEWERLLGNQHLVRYAKQAQALISTVCGQEDAATPRKWNVQYLSSDKPHNGSVVPSLSGDLMLKTGSSSYAEKSWSKRSPIFPQVIGQPKKDAHPPSALNSMQELSSILQRFSSSSNKLRQRYAKDLEESLQAYKESLPALRNQGMPITWDSIDDMIKTTDEVKEAQLTLIRQALSSGDCRYQWLEAGRLWPCTTPTALLEQLQSCVRLSLDFGLKRMLIDFGVLITIVQQLRRIQEAQRQTLHDKVLEEVSNEGHTTWDPLEYPDWLLIEIDSDFLIRPDQVEVAHAIAFPKSGNNTVLQMNMGQGKTSVIMPMAASILANGEQLSRLIVPKALLLPTAHVLISRLGGLLGKSGLHVPFSRKSPTSPELMDIYIRLHQQTGKRRGVILTTPESKLSYKLSGLQRLKDGKIVEASKMIDFQTWLTKNSREIIDESDLALAVKTQLIYPSGSQEALDGHPQRWQVVENLLQLIEDHLHDLQRHFKTGLNLVTREGGFPIAHFLNEKVEAELTRRLIQDVSRGMTPFLRLDCRVTPELSTNISDVLSKNNINCDMIKKLSSKFCDPSSAYKNLLLVRGLLKNGILLLCLKKRWNVQYGLHPERDPIAVPFEAKGVPHGQSEFGHPDAAIGLTCLAFYYAGTSKEQLRESLKQILNSEDPAAEFDRWTGGTQDLPDGLQQWNTINVDDEKQTTEIWDCLKLNRSFIVHYLNRFVFPAHARQFSVKLQASGWDLPQFSPEPGDGAANLTTGFSGTNDIKSLLPMTIRQDDLASLHQTSAEVLTYFLHARNRGYCRAAELTQAWTEEQLLGDLKKKHIRLLIDAGAYILDMDNETLAAKWLEIDWEAKAAVYFKNDNRAWVKHRGKKADTPLLVTAFADNLGDCVVYLDEAHTRGTDMKFPRNGRGALTLALGQTKDHTVQAAMRLRQLGTTQSVIFYAPPAVHQSILDVRTRGGRLTKISNLSGVDSADVVAWLLEQTCRANEQLQGLYQAQGEDFCRRANAAAEHAAHIENPKHRQSYLDVIEQREQQTLEQMYGGVSPNSNSDANSCAAAATRPGLSGFVEGLRKQRQAATSTSGYAGDLLAEVEQEREVEFQVEEVRQIRRPPRYAALEFPALDPDILRFAETGHRGFLQGFAHAFEALGDTSIGKKYGVQCTLSYFYLSAEFRRTIELAPGQLNDEFLRPVEWVLWSPSSNTALVVIPEEAELLLPTLRRQSQPLVHLLIYAAPVTKAMRNFGNFTFYAVPAYPTDYTTPRWLAIELGIFAGRLYTDYESYREIREGIVKADPGTNPDDKGRAAPGAITATNPTAFLLDWLTLRRRGQDILHTPMGYLCQGRTLTADHYLFEAGSNCRGCPVKQAAQKTGGVNDADVNSPEHEGQVKFESEEDEDESDFVDGDL